mgnify:CR=1 FL=1
MKNKKILILFIISVILIVVIGYFAIKFVKQKKSNEIQNEYVPQEEISDEQSRETIVSLYFADKETGLLKPEARLVNVKDFPNFFSSATNNNSRVCWRIIFFNIASSSNNSDTYPSLLIPLQDKKAWSKKTFLNKNSVHEPPTFPFDNFPPTK